MRNIFAATIENIASCSKPYAWFQRQTKYVASDEDILSIPGTGKRILREFKEYRPYVNIEQFRKEIGKYVDKKEVARLERYVTLN